MPLLNEQDALTLVRNYKDLPPEDQAKADALLRPYKENQEARGAPMFPIAENEEQTRLNNFRSAMTVEGYEFEDHPNLKRSIEGSADKPRTRALASSMVFLANRFDLPVEEVGLMHHELKAQYSLNRWGEVVTDDNLFQTKAKQEVEKEIAVEESMMEAYRVGVRNVALGAPPDAAADYESWRETVKDKPGLGPESFAAFEKAYGEVGDKLSDYGELIRTGVELLQNNMTSSGEDMSEEIVDVLLDLPPKDRSLVISSIMAGAEEAGKSVEKADSIGNPFNLTDMRSRMAQMGEAAARTIGSAYEGMDHMERETTIDTLRSTLEQGIELPEQVTDAKGATEAVQAAIKAQTDVPEMQRTIESLGMMPQGPTRNIRKPTPEEKKLLEAALNREQSRIALERQIKQAALSSDPIKSIFSEVIGSSAAFMPIMALTARNPAAGRALAPRLVGALAARAVSLPVAAKAYQAMEYDDIMLNYPAMSSKQAREVAMASGIFMAAMDSFEWSFLKGELPSFANALSKGVAKTALGRAGVRGVEGLIFQNVQEGAQDLATPIAQMAFDMLQEDMPHRDFAKDWENWKDTRGEIALGMLPLVLIGAGAGFTKDYRGVMSMQSINQAMELNGVIETDRTTVLDFMAEGKASEAYRHLQESQLRRKGSIAKEAISKLKVDEARALFGLAEQGIGAMLTYTRVGDQHIVTIDGKQFTARSWGEARWMIEQKVGGLMNQEITEAQELANFLMDKGAVGQADFTGTDKIADTTVEQMRERVAIQSAAMGATPDAAQKVINLVLGESILNTKGSVIEKAIKIYNGGNVMTVVEEVAEANILKGIRDGVFTYQGLKEVVNNVEKITGRTFIQTDTEQGILEGVSDMVVADTIAQRKDGSRMPAGTVTRGVIAAGTARVGQTPTAREASTRFALFLNAQRHYFKQVFLSARALRKGQAEGKLDKDYRQFIDQLLGLAPEQRIVSEATTEAEAMVSGDRIRVANAPLGVVRYGGVTGKLERLGERYVVKPKEGLEVELSGEDFVDLVFETDQAVLDLFSQPEPVVSDGRTGAPTVLPETRYTAARDGTLAIISPEGRRLVPRKRKLADNVQQTPEGPAFQVKDTRSGRISLLRGARARQAIEAMLEAAQTMEGMGRKVSYSVEQRPAQSPESMRHAELEAKHNAGTITPEETAEAQRLVDERAKAAGYTNRYNHGTPNTEFTVFRLPDASVTGVARMGPGIYGAIPSDTQTTETYARKGRVIPMYVNMENVVVGDQLSEDQVSDMLSVLDAEKTLRDGNKVGKFIEQYRNSDSLNELWGLFQLTQPEKWYDAVNKAGVEGATRFSAGEENGEIVLFKQDKVKSADPFTGVPLDQRFDVTSNDIRYSIETRPFTNQVGEVVTDTIALNDSVFSQLKADPELKRAYFQRSIEALARVQREADSVAQRDMTDKEVADMRERFKRTYLNEMMNELPEDARTEAERRKALKAAEAKAEQSLKRFTQSTPEEKIRAYTRTLTAVIMGLPPANRGTLITDIRSLVSTTKLDREKALKKITKSVQKINGIIEQQLVEDYTADIKKLLKRGAPTRAAGKKPVSQLTAEASNLFEVAKLARKWSQEQVYEEVGKRESRLDKDENLTPAEEERLRKEVQIIELVGDMGNANSSRLEAILTTLESLFDEGFAERLAYTQKFDERVAKLADLFRAETGITDLGEAFNKQKANINSIRSTFAAIGRNMGSFNDLMYALSQMPDSKFAREIVNEQRKADNLRIDLDDQLDKELEEFLSELAGGGYDAVKLVHKLNTSKVQAAWGEMTQLEAAHAVLTWEQPDGRRHMEGTEKSQWYGWYTEEGIEELRGKLMPETKALMGWMRERLAQRAPTVAELFAERYGVMMPMGKNYFMRSSDPATSKGEEHDLVTGSSFSTASLMPPSLRAVATNAVAMPKFHNALALYMAREKQVNYWVAKYDFVRMMQRLFLSRDNNTYVEAVLGKEGRTMMSNWLQLETLGTVRAGTFELQRQLVAASDRVSSAIILGRLGSLMMQATGLGAISTKIPMRDFLRLHFQFDEGTLSMNEAWGEPFIERRIVQRHPAAQEAVRMLSLAAKPNRIKYAQRYLAEVLANTDGMTVATNYVIARRYQQERREVFEQQLGEQLDAGNFGAARQLVEKRTWLTLNEADAAQAFISEAELNAASGSAGKPTTFPQWGEFKAVLKEEGRLEAERITEDVVQPTRQAQKSWAEVSWNAGLAKAINPFVSDLRQKIMMLWNTSANFKKDKAAALRAYSYVLLMQGFGSYMLRNGWRWARGMDDDDVFEWDKVLLGSLGGLFTGFPGAQALLDSGSTLGMLPRSIPAMKRMVTQNPADDPAKFIADLDAVLTATSVLPVVGEYTGPMASFMHMAADAAKVIDKVQE